MFSKLFASIRGQWMGALALFLVLSGGVAYGANTVFSSDIVDGEVKTADIGNNEIRAADLRAGSVGSSEVAGSSIGSSEVADGSIRDGDLTASARGARAYAVVDGAVCADPVEFCPITRDKRVAYAVHVGEGRFCVGVDGINAAAPSSLALLVPMDSSGDPWATWRLSNSACVGTEFEIETGKGQTVMDANFTIVIP